MAEEPGEMHAKVLFRQGEERRTAFLNYIAAGWKKKDAALEVGWHSVRGYSAARAKHPQWAAAVDAAFNKARAEGYKDYQQTPSTFEGFVSRWFPDRQPHRDHQVMIARELETLRPREVAMFLLWPEAGKTATLEDWICRKLAQDPDHRIRYVSEASDLSKRVVGTCQRRFTDNSEYGAFINKYGPFYEKGQERQGKPWTTEQITVWKNKGGERDRNLVASSWKSAVYGSRIDTLVLDDLMSQNNYNQAEEVFRRIRGTFFNRGIQMRTLIIGTRIGPGDFYERMLDAGLVTKQIILPAMDGLGNPKVPEFWDQDEAEKRGLQRIVHDGGPCCMGFRECPRDGSTLTPREFMELIRHQSGEETWWASYQQEPRSNERSTFAAYIEQCLDRDRRYGTLASA